MFVLRIRAEFRLERTRLGAAADVVHTKFVGSSICPILVKTVDAPDARAGAKEAKF